MIKGIDDTVDRIFVGNLGRYNGGDIVGDWLRLPYDEKSLDDWLRDNVGVDEFHEETFIMDYDLQGPLGEVGLEAGEWEYFDSLNVAARLAEGLTPERREAVRQWVDAGGDNSVGALCNYMAQADDIEYHRLDGKPYEFSSQEQRLAYTIVGGLSGVEELSDETLEAHFDYRAFGRNLNDGGLALGEAGYLDSCQLDELDLERYDRDEGLAAMREAELAPVSIEEAIESLRPFGVFFNVPSSDTSDRCARDPELCTTLAAYLDCMNAVDYEAVSLAAECVSCGDIQGLMNVALQLERIGFLKYVHSDCDVFERVGRDIADEVGVNRGDLVAFFDFTSFGQWLVRNDDIAFTSDGVGYVNLACDVTPDRYDMSELRSIASGRSDAPDLKALSDTVACASGTQPAADERHADTHLAI